MKSFEEVKRFIAAENIPCECYVGNGHFPTKNEEFVPFTGDVGIIVAAGWFRPWEIEVHTKYGYAASQHIEYAKKIARFVEAKTFDIVDDSAAHRIESDTNIPQRTYTVSAFSGGGRGWQLSGRYETISVDNET